LLRHYRCTALLNAKQEDRKYQLLKSFGVTRWGIEPISTGCDANAKTA